MKLYQSNLSPYATRCRLQIYAKGIDGVEFEMAPGGLASEEYKRLNPTGKIPALEVDGHLIGESEVICEYLEDAFPEPSLRPESALDRAQARLLSRVADLYILDPLFKLLPHMNPSNRKQDVVDRNVALVAANLGMLEDYMTRGGYSGGDYAVGGRLTLADCNLVPTLFVVVNLLPLFGVAEPLAERPQLSSYWQNIRKNQHCARVLGEMADGFKAMLGNG